RPRYLALLLSCLTPPLFLFHHAAPPRALHSFPTRRSSDLCTRVPALTGSSAKVARTRTGAAWLTISKSRGGSLRVTSKLASRAGDRKSTRLNSSHVKISYAVFCLKKKKKK